MLNGYISYLKKTKQGAKEPGADHYIREDSADYIIEPSKDSTIIEDTTL